MTDEDLQKRNTELSREVEELRRLNDDFRALFSNTHTATLFLDRELQVRNFTPPVTEIFQISEADKGRPVGWIAHQLAEDVLGDLEHALRNQHSVERDIHLKDGSAAYTMAIQPYRTLEKKVDGVVVTFNNVTRLKEGEQRLEESERHQRLLLRELQHRVKNILANVRGLARQTLIESTDLDTFYESFEGRIEALARAQSLLNVAGHINFGDLVLDELLAHAAQPDSNVHVDGPTVLLEPRAAQTMALVIHELTTNAVKYGALTHDAGHLSVTWRVEVTDTAPTLVLDWKESGMALEEGIGKAGFGRRLIEQAAPYEIGGESQLSFPPEGCRCIMKIPFGERITLPADAGTYDVEAWLD